MSDIVERLRSDGETVESLKAKGHWSSAKILEQADTITALRAEVERLRTETKANLDLAERHMDEKHKLRAVLTWIDQQRYTNRSTINPDNAFEKARDLNKQLVEIMNRAAAALTPQEQI